MAGASARARAARRVAAMPRIRRIICLRGQSIDGKVTRSKAVASPVLARIGKEAALKTDTCRMSAFVREYELTLAALGVAALSGGCLGLGFGLLADPALLDNSGKKQRRDAEAVGRLAIGGAAATVGLYAICPAGIRQLWTAFR